MADFAGYECGFISEPDDSLKCLICLAVARDPWQHGKCGRLFCESCLNKHGKDKPCPNCRMGEPMYMEDTRSKREVRALGVRCDNVERGCEWEGTVASLDKHVATCEFIPVPCPNGCRKKIIQKDLDEHLKKLCPHRYYECSYCQKKDYFVKIINVHEFICEKKVLPCPNDDCSKTMERGTMKEHVESCEYTVISCKYKNIGCDVKMKRKDTGAHEQDDKAHLHQALNTVVKLQDNLESATRMMLSMKEESEDLAVKLRNEYDNMLRKEQNEMTAKLQSVINSQALIQGGLNLFKLAGYEKKKENDEIFITQSFYSSPDGYNMNVKVYPNGYADGKGTHMSIFVNFMNGDNDDKLNWPFIGAIKLELLNQLEDKHHFCMILTINREVNQHVGFNRGYPKCIPHSVLPHDPVKKTQYLKDDTLYFRVSVEVPGHKPWLERTTKISTKEFMKMKKETVNMKKQSFDMAVKLKQTDDTVNMMKKQQSDSIAQSTTTRILASQVKSITFKITDYKNKRDSSEIVCSKSFYTFIHGYKLFIRVYCGGYHDGKGTHLSVYSCIEEGNYDKSLNWPFLGAVKIVLLNQLADMNHYFKTVSFNEEDNTRVGSSRGYSKFFPHSQLSNEFHCYLKDDTLYFRATVIEVSSHKPWLACTVW